MGTLDGDESGYAAWRREGERWMETRVGTLDGEETGNAAGREDGRGLDFLSVCP